MRRLGKLEKAVIYQLGYTTTDLNNDDLLETLKNVCNNGASGGIHGFIYYSDTEEFFEKNKKLILEKLESDYIDFGYKSISDMLLSFNCINSDTPEHEIYKILYSKSKKSDCYTEVSNALAWYCLEETARSIIEY